MPDLFIDPRIGVNYSEHNWPAVQSSEAARDAVINDFLSEKLCTIHGYSVTDIDWEFLAGVSFPQTWAMKKFQFRGVINEAEKPPEKQPLTTELYRSVFGVVALTISSTSFG